MIRPSLVLFSFLVVILGLAATSEAAEFFPTLLAQSAAIRPLRGPGLYLNLFKFVPVVLIYLMWAWTTDWVEHDTQDLNNLKFGVWNSVMFFSGVLGLILVLAIPFYPIGLGLLLLAYFIPLFTYVFSRNQMVPDDQKVLTPYHLGEVANSLIMKLGGRPLFNKDTGPEDRAGPPIQFVGKGQGGKDDPSRVNQA
ncbi:MAG: type II/IV secretion system protein, partial [Isosphaeraceae bacterium]